MLRRFGRQLHVARRPLSDSKAKASEIDYSYLPKMKPIPEKKKGAIEGFFRSLFGYERVEFLETLMGIKDRLYERSKMSVTVKGNAASPTYIPATDVFRIVGCTGVPADSHALVWFRVYQGKMTRCGECGHAVVAYDFDAYLRDADEFCEWANRFTSGYELENGETDAFIREDILNLAEDESQDRWSSLVASIRKSIELLPKDVPENQSLLASAKANRFLNWDGDKIIFGKKNKK